MDIPQQNPGTPSPSGPEPPPGTPRRYFEPPAPDPPDPGGGFQGFPGKPSGGLLALGIVTIIFAALLLLMNCCGAGGFLSMMLLKNSPAFNQPGTAEAMQIYNDPAFAAFAGATVFLNLVIYSFALAGGIGLLKLRQWARKICMWYAVATIVIVAVSSAVNLIVFNPRMQAAFASNPLASFMQGNPAMQALGIAFNFACYDTLPVVLLIVLTRASVKAQFEAAEKMRLNYWHDRQP